MGLATIYLPVKRYHLAVRAYDAALQTVPTHKIVFRLRALAHYQAGNHELARRNWHHFQSS